MVVFNNKNPTNQRIVENNSIKKETVKQDVQFLYALRIERLLGLGVTMAATSAPLHHKIKKLNHDTVKYVRHSVEPDHSVRCHDRLYRVSYGRSIRVEGYRSPVDRIRV